MNHIPTEPPALDPLKLITMTVSSHIDHYFNLDVLARYTVLDSTVIGIHYRDIHRGNDMEEHDETSEADISSAKSGRFKNQCTFVIDNGQKVINTKLFNNGKMVNVGCKDPDQAVFTAKTLISKFKNMSGHLRYTIPKTLKGRSVKELKKFFKDDLRKKFGNLIQLLVCYMNMNTNLECFDPSMTNDDSFLNFMETCETDPHFVQDIMYLSTIITVLKCYYPESALTERFGDERFQWILNCIIENTDHEQGMISFEFPAYITDESNPIVFDEKNVRTVLINKSTKCGYFINRTALQKILEDQPDIIQCKFDKGKYPGVLAQYKTTDGKLIKIIIFNTGKINITAAETHQQVQEGFDFIGRICHEFFGELLLRCEYENKQKEYEGSMPDQHFVGVYEGQSYYLLYKQRIVANPRNLRCLHSLGILDKYR